MKKIILICISIILSIGLVNALSDIQKGSILDIFKKKQYDLLFESDLGDFSSEFSDIFDISKKVGIYDKIGDNNKEKLEAAKKQKDMIVDKISSLKGSIKQLDLDISNTLIRVNKINEKIISVKKDVAINKKTILILQRKVIDNKKILLEYLVYLFKKGNVVYNNGDIDNLKSILLNDETIGDLVNDLYFKGIIEVAGKKLIDKHRTALSNLYMNKVSFEKQEQTLKQLRKSGIIQKKILADKKEFKERILKISKGQQSFYEKYVYDKLKLEKKLQLQTFKEKVKFNSIRKNILKKYNCKFVDISKISAEYRALSGKCLDINKMIYSESKLERTDEEEKNIFSWPINPDKGISSYFHDTEYERDFGSTHDAIDIISKQGTSIKAPADGYVVYIQEPNTSDYAYIALKHHDGYMTVYGHVSDILVEEFDYVKKGEVFAQTGGEYGTFGAGYLTTGPHLHFEVFKDKKYIDPFTVLDLSFIQFSRLSEKYKFKFYSDFKTRRGYEYKQKSKNSRLFHLEGDTEIERQKYLINKYAVGTFNDWRMWVDESLDGNIDPSFVMCVGLAETTLGKYLKTPYNIGNIGNTDSGSTKTFPNARSGVYWMMHTFNNRYLSQYNEIGQLSRYGNKDLDKPIYASSPDNWHNNIIKCLSHLKGTYVPDNYNFRIMN